MLIEHLVLVLFFGELILELLLLVLEQFGQLLGRRGVPGGSLKLESGTLELVSEPGDLLRVGHIGTFESLQFILEREDGLVEAANLRERLLGCLVLSSDHGFLEFDEAILHDAARCQIFRFLLFRGKSSLDLFQSAGTRFDLLSESITL